MISNSYESLGELQPKKKKGFQPLQMNWSRYFVDAVFRGGDKHSNHGDTVQKMIGHMVKKIRKSVLPIFAYQGLPQDVAMIISFNIFFRKEIGLCRQVYFIMRSESEDISSV
jgi:hypothetical protein